MYSKLLQIGPLAIHTYGCFLALAFLYAIYIQRRLARYEKIPPDIILNLTIYLIFAALIGAKLLLFLVDFDYYLSRPVRFIEILRLGGVYYGGFICAVIVGILYTRKKKLHIWKVADIIAPSIAAGQAIGRIGCFLAGCCYGRQASDIPWAVTFTSYYAHDRVGVPLNIPLHPTQLYASLNALVIFILLLLFYRRKSFHGQIFWTYILLYSLSRGVLEYFRGDPRGFVIPNLLSTSQFISILLMVLSGVMISILRKRMEKD